MPTAATADQALTVTMDGVRKAVERLGVDGSHEHLWGCLTRRPKWFVDGLAAAALRRIAELEQTPAAAATPTCPLCGQPIDGHSGEACRAASPMRIRTHKHGETVVPVPGLGSRM